MKSRLAQNLSLISFITMLTLAIGTAAAADVFPSLLVCEPFASGFILKWM